MCFALVLMTLLCWGNYVLETMREYTMIDVGGFVAQAPEVLVHLRELFNSTNTTRLLSGLWNLMSSWCKRRQFWGEVTLNHALRWLVHGWQSMWKYLGRCIGKLSAPIAWVFLPEQASNPCEFMCHLIEGCLEYSNKKQ